MNTLTLGQRIAAERKKSGLSQESLGDRLGVSRQAISKWEADAAIPEIDKLIALSRLFSVSVADLLGIEESPQAPTDGGQAEDSPSAGDDLTETQLEMVERIVRRLQPEAPVRKRRWLPALSLTLAAAGFLFGLLALQKASQIPDYSLQLASLQTSYNSLSSQLRSLGDAAESLRNQSSLLSEWSLSVKAAEDLSGGEITLQAMPRVRQQGDQAVFTVWKDEASQVLQADCLWNGTGYAATIFVPKGTGYRCSVTITHADGSSEFSALPYQEDEVASALYYDFETGFSYQASGDLVCNWDSRTPDEVRIPTLDLEIDPPYLAELPPTFCTRADLVLVLDGQELQRICIYRPEGGDDLQYDANVSGDGAPTNGNLQMHLSAKAPLDCSVPIPALTPEERLRFRFDVFLHGKEAPISFFANYDLTAEADGIVVIASPVC